MLVVIQQLHHHHKVVKLMLVHPVTEIVVHYLLYIVATSINSINTLQLSIDTDMQNSTYR